MGTSKVRSPEVDPSSIWHITQFLNHLDEIQQHSLHSLSHFGEEESPHDPKTVPVKDFPETASRNYDRMVGVNHRVEFGPYLNIVLDFPTELLPK